MDRFTKSTILILSLTLFIAIGHSTGTVHNRPYAYGSDKLGMLIKQAHAYFVPPNLDFRKGRNDGDDVGAGEKVKGAVSKSLEHTKETVEDSAKIAGHTVQKTAAKVKKKLTEGGGGAPNPQAEL